MSRKGRILREKRAAEETQKKEYLQNIFSLKVHPKKYDPHQEIEMFLDGEDCYSNDKVHSRHPLRNVTYNNKTNKEVLSCILHKTFKLEMMIESKYCEALKTIADYSEYFIRSIHDWVPSTHNRHRQFSNLLRWLFVKYEMPLFMDSIWCECNNYNKILWYIEIGSGESVYKVMKDETGLTRKMSHIFMNAPDDLTIEEAIKYAEFIGHGGEQRMIGPLMGSGIVNKGCNDFWSSLSHLFARNPMMDVSQIGPIVDYVSRQRENNDNYSIKGRTITSILKCTEEWHKDLARSKKLSGLSWDGFNLPDWEYVDGKKEEYEEGFDLGKNQKRYDIKQILLGKELAKEGKTMNHCVYSYSRSCQRGESSIWSLRTETISLSSTRLLTIEVENRTRSIVQIRGKNNRIYKNWEKSILNKWALESNLKFGVWA